MTCDEAMLFSSATREVLEVSSPVPVRREAERLDDLRELGLLDTESEERFDRLTRLAQALFRVPVSLVSLLDNDRQWFKSKVGVDVCETARNISFCAHVVAEDAMLVVEDACLDNRFRDNPFVIGPPHLRFYAGLPLYGTAGLPIGSFCVAGTEPRRLLIPEIRHLVDLAALAQKEITSRESATTDYLTGLLNRRGFLMVAEQAISFCNRNQSAACLLFIDLDKFKAINDAHGHYVGDRALQQFARCLVETFRAADVVARLGGDEFVVLMSNSSLDAVQLALQRLQADVDSLNAWPGTFYQLQFSAGFAQVAGAGDHEGLRLAMRLADDRMYAEKNRRKTAGPEGSSALRPTTT